MSLKIPRVEMPLQESSIRKTNFTEVSLGYDLEMAKKEASRCLQCRRPFCQEACPVGVDIPQFIQAIPEENLQKAADIIKGKNALPAICGRVCPQESQCEGSCILARKGEAVAIGNLERFVADWEAENGSREIVCNNFRKEKIAIIGSGPAGLACAGDLAKLGYKVQILEALHNPGGVLTYGIPEFRLPQKVVNREIAYIENLGVQITNNSVIGKLYTIDELLDEEGFSAVFIASGAGLPYFLNIPGENLNGVYSANEFLTRVNLMKAYDFPNNDTPVKVGKKVAVIGAGNVAMDAARTALRLGAEESSIIYRRSRDEIPARKDELLHAEEEGVELLLLTSPVELKGNDKNKVVSMRCVRYELGDEDSSGRRSPVEIKGSDFSLEVDTVIVAIGQGVNPLIPDNTPGLELNKKGNIKTDENFATSRKGVFAGGDIVTGSATVILAMGTGRKAASAIHQYLTSEK